MATLLVKRSVCPFTAPVTVEYSPAKEQVEIVTTVPAGFIAAEPNEDVNVHPGGGTQLVHCTVVVRQVVWVPQAALVLQCANNVPVNVLAKTNGVCPKATTGPLNVPVCIVIKSVATLLVKRRV